MEHTFAPETFVKHSKKAFKKRLSSILLYGSAKQRQLYHDFDLMVVLATKGNVAADLQALQKITNQWPDAHIDLQLLYAEEIEIQDNFSLDTHGCFVIEVLKESEVLFGKNPFIAMTPSPNRIKQSVLQKIQYYVFRARQSFFGYQIHAKDQNPDFHRKKILFAIQDLLLAENIHVDAQRALEQFTERHPEVLTASEAHLFRKAETPSLEQLLPVYEKIYSFALARYGKASAEEPPKPSRWNCNGIVTEYLFPKIPTKSAIILCDGLPGVPQQHGLMHELSKKGFAVFFPRYRGTWESDGTFLERSPERDIEELIKELRVMKDRRPFKQSFDRIFLIGTSFGGAVSLSLGNHPQVERAVSLSPVFDFTKLNGMDSLCDFLRDAWMGAYRFDISQWKLLASGELLAPETTMNEASAKKHLVIGGKEDTQIPQKQLKAFCAKHKLDCRILENTGHISLRRIQGNLLTTVLDFLS